MLTIDHLVKIDNIATRIIHVLHRGIEWVSDHYEARLVDAAYRVAESKAAAIGKADLTAGKQAAVLKLPSNLRRYIRVYYTVGTGPLTAGKFSAQIVMDYNRQRAYPNAV